jgi:hypothetical protein
MHAGDHMPHTPKLTARIRTIMTTTLTCLSLIASSFISTAHAAEDVPLAIIRFNQGRVYYEQQLFKAVSAAVRTKPDVVFDVVSFIPKSKDKAAQVDIDTMAEKQSSQILDSLKDMGVAPSSIHYSKEHDSTLRDQEIQIYVR